MLPKTIIRAFDGSLADAEGLLAVEKATFDEIPYSAQEIQAMLTGEAHRVWLAVGDDQVVGFVAAFLTSGLLGPSWEIDLLAVKPAWTGQGLGTRLIRKAAAGGMAVARRARAVVATDNAASARAFARVGFRRAGNCDLLIYRPEHSAPQPWTALGVTIGEVDRLETLAEWLPEGVVPRAAIGSATTLLRAEHQGQPSGYAELLEVQTLLYQGVWIESLAASNELVRLALIHETVNRAATAGLDEIGMMAPEQDLPLRQTLREAGFRSLGSFDWFVAGLPLPGLASAKAGPTGEVHV